MRIVITGAAGFIGSHIIPLLLSGSDEILLMARDEKEQALLSRYDARTLIGDLGEINLIKNEIIDFSPEVCIHLAWDGIPDYSYEVSKRNLDNSLKLVNLMMNETECRKLIVSGSCYEYGKTEGTCGESEPVNINSFISWAKYSLCRYMDLVCAQAGVTHIWFRIFYVYGPGQRKEALIPSLVSSFKKGSLPKVSYPMNANDFIYVGDVARAFEIAARQDLPSGIYNLGSGSSTRIFEICEMVEMKISGKTEISNRIRDTGNTEQKVNFWADPSKSRKLLSWQPQISFAKGISEYVNSTGGKR